jgi:phage terminase large subunit-like protein
LNAAVREFETVIRDRRLRHDGNPVMRWCTANASVQANPTGELRPTKRRSRDRIDVAVASLFALSGYLRQTTDDRHTRQ